MRLIKKLCAPIVDGGLAQFFENSRSQANSQTLSTQHDQPSHCIASTGLAWTAPTLSTAGRALLGAVLAVTAIDRLMSKLGFIFEIGCQRRQPTPRESCKIPPHLQTAAIWAKTRKGKTARFLPKHMSCKAVGAI